MKFHLHVYPVETKMLEVDIIAKSEEEARNVALDLARQGKLKQTPADCLYVAVSFPADEEK